jgi:hypothetical protein
VTYSVHGIHFNVGVWAKIPEDIKVGQETFALSEYLRSLRSDDESQPLFEVTDLSGAKTIEASERERAEREALAAKPTPGSISLVDRAATPAGVVAAPAKERADGEEIISSEEKADVEAASEADAEEAKGDAPDAEPVSSRRAARAARQKAKADS